MRLHRLELEGFGPFLDRQVVDFDAFADDGIFLIAGRTGAGKSSVLDAVCFALYGGVPRYEGTEKRLRSDHCGPDDPTSVSVEFSAGGRRWRVERSPEYERAKKRGSGTTLVAPEAQLHELVDGGWVGRAAGPRNVALELDAVLGLSQQQFLQVILLAQNRFAEFLLAKNDERQKLLRRLFGTRTYEDYQQALEQRRKDAADALASAGAGVALLVDEAERLLAALGPWEGFGTAIDGIEERGGADAGADPGTPTDIAGRLAAAERGARRARSRTEALREQQDAAVAAARDAEAAFATASALHTAQQQRIAAVAAIERLEADAPVDDHVRATLAGAVAAEALRAPIEAAAEAETAVARTDAVVDDRRAAWRAGGDAEDADADALRRVIDELTGRLAVWAEAEAQERRLVEVTAQLAEAETRAERLEHEISQLDAGRAGVPARLHEIEIELRAALEQAGRLADARAHLAVIGDRLAAATEAVGLESALREAEAAQVAAIEEHDRARAGVTALLRRRLAGHAAELAARLLDGEPCAVCGATEHPAPARADGDPVTDDELAAAEAARDAAAAIETAAVAAARAARDEHGAAVARAGGEPVDALAVSQTAAAAAVAAALDAVAARDRLTAEQDALAAADEAAAQERGAAEDALTQVRVSIAALQADAATLQRAVDDARADFASVAARIADADARRGRAVALADALAASATTRLAADRARAYRDARIAESEFAGAAEAVDALKDATTRAALAERVREHEVATRSAKMQLTELDRELRGTPPEPVDLASAAAARDAARAAEKAAVAESARASQSSRHLSDLVQRATAAHAGIAALAADHDVVARLANTVAGRAPNTHRMTLESFVLAAELEEIVEAANLRLDEMSSGRYRLQHTDARAARNAASGLGLEIMDAHTGMARPAQSLSGGETFLASLALALGLAEVVTARAGGVRLDTLFIDEGFGSLDEDTLDLAMRTLDELRQGGRTVGLISHVAAMKEQLPAQLVVEATVQGRSVIRQAAITART